jgi:hypothetical protein
MGRSGPTRRKGAGQSCRPLALRPSATGWALALGLAILLLSPAASSARPTQGASDQLGDGYRLGKARLRTDCFSMNDNGGRRRGLCVHWATRTRDAPPAVDKNRNGRPDQVDATIRTVRKVWRVEIDKLGYRAPKRDRGPKAGQGPNRGLDLYLVDVGAEGLYGYCVSDSPRRHRLTSQPKHRSAHAYCVLDNDFEASQYLSSISGRPALKVTVAHEFFHAVQSAYEAAKKERWLREGTAVWMEEAVFGDVNASYAFLPESPLQQPEVPLDAFQRNGDGEDFEYGAWVFWRFLSEYYNAPNLIRDVWQEAAPRKGEDKTALEAVRAEVAHHRPDPSRCHLYCGRPTFSQVLSEFSYWVRNYPQTYSEGGGFSTALKGELPPSDAEFLLTDSASPTIGGELPVDHLSSRQVRVLVDPSTLGNVALRVSVTMPHKAQPDAFVEATSPDGTATYPLDPDATGHAALELSHVSDLSLVLVNASGHADGQRYSYAVERLP